MFGSQKFWLCWIVVLLIPTQLVFAKKKKSMADYEPPDRVGVEWIEVEYTSAEGHVLEMFNKDIPKLSDQFKDLVIFSVQTKGPLPSQHGAQLKAKIENAILSRSKIRIKECTICSRARIRRVGGKIKYSMDRDSVEFRRQVVDTYGTKNLLLVEEIFNQEELLMRVKVLDGENSDIQWVKDYNFDTQTYASNESKFSKTKNTSRFAKPLLLGEIAFKTVFSPGVSAIPSIDTGAGSTMVFQPTVDITIGERYDGGHKEFGFNLGFNINLDDESFVTVGEPVPFLVRLAPQFKYVFNPLNSKSIKFALQSEVGVMVGQGMTAFFMAVGPEFKMINRFSVSIIPTYIFSTDVKTPVIEIDNGDGFSQETSSERVGTFGGLGLMIRANMNW